MTPNLTEDEIDDLLYFARTGSQSDYESLLKDLCIRENTTILAILQAAKDPYSGNGALHMAAANGHSDLLTTILTQLCLSQSIQPTPLINTPNNSGNTALHWAALNGHLPAVKVLIDNGADPTLTNDAGHDPVYEAEVNDRKDVVEWVLKEGGEGLESGLGGEGEDDEEADEMVGKESDGSGGAGGKRLDDELMKGLEDMGFKEEEKKS